MRILYIEDNANDAKLVQRYVETTAHELAIASTIEQAYEQLSDSPEFDLILIDILINNKRLGYDLAHALREQGYSRPVIAITALTSPQDQAACAEAGFAAVLLKPFMITALAKVLLQFS